MGETAMCNFFLWEKKERKKEKIAAAINPETLKQENGVRTAKRGVLLEPEGAAGKCLVKIPTFLHRERKDTD